MTGKYVPTNFHGFLTSIFVSIGIYLTYREHIRYNMESKLLHSLSGHSSHLHFIAPFSLRVNIIMHVPLTVSMDEKSLLHSSRLVLGTLSIIKQILLWQWIEAMPGSAQSESISLRLPYLGVINHFSWKVAQLF